MKTILLISAALGLSISAAGACEYMRSAQIDSTIVASTTDTTMPTMSTPVTSEEPSTPSVLIEEKS